MTPIRFGMIIVLSVLWSTLPRTASADVCEVDLTVETSDIGQTYRLIVGESGEGLALCLAPEPSEEDAASSRLAEEPRLVAHVAATGECVTTTDCRLSGRRDPFTLLEVVVAGHNVVLDYQPDGLACADPGTVAPAAAGSGLAAVLAPVGRGDIDVEVLNLEDDSSMGVYTGPDPDGFAADGPMVPLGGGASPSCNMGSYINAWHGMLMGSPYVLGVCAQAYSYPTLICSFAPPTSNYFYIYGNGYSNFISPDPVSCGPSVFLGGFYGAWTAYPRVYGYGGSDTIESGSPLHSVLFGGDGDDTLEGGEGVDYLYGQEGCD